MEEDRSGPWGPGGATTRCLLFCMSRECLVWQFSRISSAWGTKSPRAFTFDVNKFYPKTQLSWLARLEHSHCNSADPLTDGLEVHLCEALFRCQPRETPPRRSSGRSTAHSSQEVRALQPRRTRYPRGIQPPAQPAPTPLRLASPAAGVPAAGSSTGRRRRPTCAQRGSAVILSARACGQPAPVCALVSLAVAARRGLLTPQRGAQMAPQRAPGSSEQASPLLCADKPWTSLRHHRRRLAATTP